MVDSKIVKVIGDQDVPVKQKATGELIVEDTGLNTNPRKYEKDNGFVSAVGAVALVKIWATGIAAVNPVGGRTAGKKTTIYTFVIYNPTGAVQQAWLATGVAGATRITPLSVIAPADTVVIDFVGGMNVGDMDIWLGTSAATVQGQVTGTEA